MVSTHQCMRENWLTFTKHILGRSFQGELPSFLKMVVWRLGPLNFWIDSYWRSWFFRHLDSRLSTRAFKIKTNTELYLETNRLPSTGMSHAAWHLQQTVFFLTVFRWLWFLYTMLPATDSLAGTRVERASISILIGIFFLALHYKLLLKVTSASKQPPKVPGQLPNACFWMQCVDLFMVSQKLLVLSEVISASSVSAGLLLLF